MEGGTLNAIWAELALNTKPFKKGLTESQLFVAQFGRKVSADLRLMFFNSFSPTRIIPTIANFIRSAMSEVDELTRKSKKSQIEFGMTDIALEDVAKMQVLVDRIGVPMERLAILFRDASASGAEFRGILASISAQVDPELSNFIRGMEHITKEMRTGVWGAVKGGNVSDHTAWKKMTSMIPGSRYLTSPMPMLTVIQDALKKVGLDASGGFAGMLGAGGKREADAEKRIRDLAKMSEDDGKLLTGWRNLQDKVEKQEKVKKLKAEMEGFQLEAKSLSDRVGRFSNGQTGGGLASIGGFTAGAGLNAATIASQQLNVLKLIERHAQVTAEMARLQGEMATQ